MKSFSACVAGLIATAVTLTAGPAVQAASVETSCTGYARAVTQHLRPGAAKGSPEYRAVYFPTYEECQRRGGSTAMPGGLAAAPWYLPAPPKPAANPYNPPLSAASPTAPGAVPPAPVATPKPPVAPAAPVGPTPAQVIATAAQKIAQGLPGGMNYPHAVKVGLEGCGKFAIFQANAAGPNGSAKWQETASGAVNWCVQKGGVINGDFTSSPHISLALRMIKYKTAPASAFPRHAGVPGNHACAAVAGAPDYLSCVTDQAQWFVCYASACHLAEPALVPPGGGEAVTVFHNCPGAQCRLAPPKPLASGQSLDAAARARIAQCNEAATAAAAGAGAPGSPAWNQAGQGQAAQCLGSSQPRVVGVAANKVLGTTKGRECGVGEDGQTVWCVDDDGNACIVQRDGTCHPTDERVNVTTPPPYITPGSTNFFNCPAGQCMIPGTDGPRNPPGPPPGVYDPQPDVSEPEYKRCVAENQARGEPAVKACFIERCIAASYGHPLLAGASEAQRVRACELAYERHKRNFGPHAWREVTERFERKPARPESFWETPAGEWLGFIAATAGVGLIVAGAIAGAPVILVAGGAAAGAAVLIGVGAGSSGGAVTGKEYGVLGDAACRPHMARLIAQAGAPASLDAANLRAVEDLLTELCALNLPDVAQIRAMQRGSYRECEAQARKAQPVNGAPPIVAVSRALNHCLRQTSLQAAEKALLPRSDGTRFADQWSALLRDCSASWGLEWRGTPEEGAAWPMTSAAGPDPLGSVSLCMLGSIP